MATSGRQATLAKRSLVIAGHRTSISLEDAFWCALQRLAARRDQSVASLVASIDAERGEANLSSTIRVVLLREAEARGEVRADHHRSDDSHHPSEGLLSEGSAADREPAQ